MLARTKLSSIESKISDALINNDISHEDFMTIINEEKNIEDYPRVSNTSNGKTKILSKCATCSSKKSRFINNQEPKGLLSSLGLRTP